MSQDERQLTNCTNKLKPWYVPLVWGHKQKGAQNSILDDIHYILGFNEPNHEIFDMTPYTAARHWKAIETRAPG